MRIALEARALAAHGGGIRRYVEELLRQVVQQNTVHDIHVLYSRLELLKTFPDLHEHAVPLTSDVLFWKWLWRDIPRELARVKPDIVHFTKVDMPFTKKYPTVVTIYDVIPLLFPESQTALKRLYWPHVLHRSAQMSDHIMTISEASKQDIIKTLGVSSDKVTVTPLAIDQHRFAPAAEDTKKSLRQKYKLDKPYILFVSTIEPRKNVPGLIRAFAQSAKHVPHDLVIAGKFYLGQEAVRKEIQRSNLDHRIKVLDFVEPGDLPTLYSAADLFVWPSLYEGWGLPPLEAMACGVPVIVSNGGSLPEVVGQAGEVVSFSTSKLDERTHDDMFELKLSEAMIGILKNSLKSQQMIQAGKKQATQFSWQSVAQKTLAVYERIV